jgi:hypothetical protein
VARREQFSNSFSAGEIAPELLMRSDLQTRNEALKQGRNIRIMQGGGFRRRPGTVDLAPMPGDAVVQTLGIGDDDARLLVFYNAGFQERLVDGTLVQDLGGAPWVTADLPNLQFAIEIDRIVVTGGNFWPAQLSKSTGVWTVANLAFKAGLNGAVRQPYWRYAPVDVTIAPAAYTGAGVAIVASAAVFSAAYVGTRIRYGGIEILITAYTDPTHLTGTVQGNLYPTISVTVASSVGFEVGQEVQGETSQIKGAVAAVPDATHVQVQLAGSYTYFLATEKLIGPTAVSAISAVGLVGTPAVSVDWDEQLISAAKGYPRTCALHKTRLLLGAFPSAENAFAASAIGDITDFDVGTGLDTDAIVDTIGRDATLGIKHFGSAEQLLFLTESGPHYVPEQVAAPLSASNLELLKIGPEAAGLPTPTLAAEGMLFSELRSGRVMLAAPTGNVRRSWEIQDLSELAYHLMGSPTELVLLAASSESDRLVCQLRSDGQIAVMNYRRNQQFTAWTLWSTTGAWRSITSAGGKLFAVAKRNFGFGDTYRLEVFEEGVWGDGFVAGIGSLAHLNGAIVGAWYFAAKVAATPVSGGALVTPPTGVPSYEVGLDFDVVAEVVPPIDGTIGLARKIRICRAWLDVLGSLNIRINGQAATGYSNMAGLGGALAPFTGQISYYLQGRTRDMTLTITQTEGGPCEVRSLTMEVTT